MLNDICLLHGRALSTMGNTESTIGDLQCDKCIHMETNATKYRNPRRHIEIKAAREGKGLTLDALGKTIGAGKAAISKWEKDPDIEIESSKFFALCSALQLDPYELLTGEKTKKKSELLPRRASLIEAYGRLPDEVRFGIRALIEALDRAGSERYATWSKQRHVEAVERDSKRRSTEKEK